MIDKLSKLLDQKGVKYWDFRQGSVKANTAEAWNSHIKRLKYEHKKGSSLRVLYNNAWSFVYFEDGDIKDIAKKAVNIAKALDAKTKIEKKIYTGKPIKATKKTKCKINPQDISLEEKKDMVLKFSKPQCDKTKNNLVTYFDMEKSLLFCNSEGSEINQDLIYTYCGCSVSVQGKSLENFDIRKGAQCGFEITKQLPEVCDTAHKKALALLDALIPKGGQFPVVCDGVLTDVFIHEALGHATEADIVLQKDSCLEDKYGKSLAQDFVNIFDDATIPNEWGSFFYDDEGIPAQKTQLITNGKLTSFLHSRETAAMLGYKPTGNGRAQGTGYLPQVRMSNTYIEKGDYESEEIFEGIKHGFFLKGSRGGQVDTAKGNFQFSAQEGYLIENGEKTKLLKGVSLAGNTLGILKNISRISKTYEPGFPGYCGKGGQSVPVMGNCPKIFIKKAIVGGKS